MLRRIIAPLVAPGLIAGCLVVFVWSFTEIGTPLMLGYERATPVQLYNGLNGLDNDPTPFALAAVLLAIAVALSLVAQVLVSGERSRTSARGGGMQPQPCGAARSAWCWLVCGGVALIACLPHLGVIGVAFSRDWYQSALPSGATLLHARDALAHPLVVPSVLNSLWFSVLATALCLLLALAVAWTVQRWRLPGARLLDALAMAPLAIPGVVMVLGFLTLGVMAAKLWPAARPILDPMQNPTLLLVIAYAVRRLPQALRSVSAGLSQVPVELEEAAAACGAGPWQRMQRIILPLIAGALAAGGILAFSFAMLEVADSLILAQQREFWPITKVIFDLVNVLGQGPALACAFGVWAMLFLAAALAAAAAAIGKPLGDLLRDR